MRNRLAVTAGVAALSCTLAVGIGAGVSGASGHGHKTPVTMTGDNTCQVNNLRLHFSTPLTATPTAADSTVRVSGDVLRKCTNVGTGKFRVRGGHLRGLVGTVPAGTTCAGFLAGSTLPALDKGSARWVPLGHVAASTGISFPAGAMSVSATNHLQLAYAGGTVTGSYATSAAALAGTSRQDTAALSGACATGLASIGFKGSATL